MNNPFKIKAEQTDNRFYTCYQLSIKNLEGDEEINIMIEVPVDSTDTEVQVEATIAISEIGLGEWVASQSRTCMNNLVKTAESMVAYYKLWRAFLDFYELNIGTDYGRDGGDKWFDVEFLDTDIPKLVQIAQEHLAN